MTFSTEESRVNVLVRLVGLVVFFLGTMLSYFTYTEAVHGNIVPEIVPVFYLVGGIMVVTGLIAIVVKYK